MQGFARAVQLHGDHRPLLSCAERRWRTPYCRYPLAIGNLLAPHSLVTRNRGYSTMRTLTKITAATALLLTSAPVAPLVGPAAAATRHHHYYSHTRYRHKVCRRSPAVTGTVVGGVAGAAVGHSLLGHGLLGVAAGAVGGAVAGGAVDRSMTARYRCYYTR
jgi:hypothetical protein